MELSYVTKGPCCPWGYAGDAEEGAESAQLDVKKLDAASKVRDFKFLLGYERAGQIIVIRVPK